MRDTILSQITRHFLPVEATVLGVKLPPFTLWHYRQLAIYESPYAQLRHGDSIGELAVAVRICATPVGQPVSLKGTWRDRLAWKIKAMAYESRQLVESQVFLEWLLYQLIPPARFTKGSGPGIKCPSWLFLASLLIKCGMPPADAWAMRVGEARCYIAAIAVSEGGGDFLTDEWVEEMLASGTVTLEELGLE
jgi:hypothetical protein